MQPLMYLAARTLIGWLSFMERKEHALRRDARIMVAVGALHCWAVAYALFIAVHTRAMRYDGYQDTTFGEYTDHLPPSVSIAEKLTLSSIWLWLLATFVSAVKSVLEDENPDLPLDCREQTGTLNKFLSSPSVSNLLALANTGACAGLFMGILLLCVSMAIMKGGITACEVSLAMLSFAFALPHAVVALQRVVPEISLALPGLAPEAVQAAAAEATVLAPQLCVVLSLADSPGHAHTWQNCVYVAAALATLWAMLACAAAPRVVEGEALPPEEPETLVCFIANAMSAIVLVLSYPELNTWFVWLAIIAFVVGTTAGYSFWREFAMDWLDQMLVVRADTDKKLRSPSRDNARRCAWVATLLCGAAAVWDIATVPPVTDHAAVEPDYLLLRFKSDSREPEKLMADVAGSLQVDVRALVLDYTDKDHRLMIFRHVPTGPMGRGELPVSDRWKDMAASLPRELAGAIESGFPHLLNITVCYDETIFPPPPTENETAPPRDDDHRFGHSTGAHAAYEVACHWRALQISRHLHQLRLFQAKLQSDDTEYTVRWLPREPPVTGQEMLAAVAPALGVEVEALSLKQEFPGNRMAVFAHKPASVEHAALVPGRWRELVAAPTGGLKEVLDPTFPTELNFSICTDESVFPVVEGGGMPVATEADDAKLGGGQGAFLAYLGMCHWRINQILHVQEALKKQFGSADDGSGSGDAALAAPASNDDDASAKEGDDLA